MCVHSLCVQTVLDVMRSCDSLDSRQQVVTAVIKASPQVRGRVSGQGQGPPGGGSGRWLLVALTSRRTRTGNVALPEPWPNRSLYCYVTPTACLVPRSSHSLPTHHCCCLLASLTASLPFPVQCAQQQALSALSADAVFLSTLNTWVADLVVERSDANLPVLLKLLELLAALKAASWAGLTASGLCVTAKKAAGHRNKEVASKSAALLKVCCGCVCCGCVVGVLLA